MEKYTYIRKTVTWQHHRYEVRGKTEQEACDSWRAHHQPQKHSLCRCWLHHRGPEVRPVAGHLQGSLQPNDIP